MQLSASENIPTEEEVAKLYVATFNRAPDSAGLNYWVNDSGLTLSKIAQSFFDQPETKELYPDGTANRDFIASVYQNLFNREPDTAGANYWENELDIGSFSKNSFILAVINGAKDNDDGNDATILDNKMTVGLSFSEAGLSNVDDAKSIMVNVTANTDSIESAISLFGITKYGNENISPIAEAGSEQTTTEGESVTLDASSSYDSDGYIVKYVWEDGNNIISESSIFSKTDFSVGSHTITLTITDDKGATSTDTVVININNEETTSSYTYLSHITESTTLSVDNSPYKVSSTIYITKDATLTINQGVEIIGESFGKVIVYGSLKVEGTADNFVKLTDLNIEPTGDLYRSTTTNIEINYAEVTGGRLFGFSSYGPSGIFILRNSILNNSNSAINLGSLTLTEDCYIEKNIFNDYGTIYLKSDNNQIFVNNNVFVGDSQLNIDGADNIVIKNNSFLSIDEVVIESDKDVEIDATNNYWNSTDGTSIRTMINSSIYIKHVPYLTSPDVDTPEYNIDMNQNNDETSQETVENDNAIIHNGLIYGIVTSPITGRVWLDRNLGAKQICQSATDEDCYGYYYQWGRETDGHEVKNSPSTNDLSDTIVPEHNAHIFGSNDWTTGDVDGSVRELKWNKIDGTSICPVDYRLPTYDEMYVETVSARIENGNTFEDTFENFLKLPRTGMNLSSNFFGKLSYDEYGTEGYYWLGEKTISQDQLRGYYLKVESISMSLGFASTSIGMPVRCIKD
jgi:uncharacterized protein (TIGR02145 family)